MQIAITIDTDSVNQNNRYFDNTRPVFGYEKELNGLLSSLGLPTTVFVRIDQQVRDVYRDYLYMWKAVDAGAELAWHPHVFGHNGQILRGEAILENLVEVYDSNPILEDVTGIRVGGAQMNRAVMNKIAEWKFIYDSSCVPGLSRDDRLRSYDWSQADRVPYNPSRDDYQSPGDLPVLEIPITVFLIETKYDQGIPKLRQANLSYRPELFRTAFESFLETRQELLVFASHGEETIHGYEDQLYVYGVDNYLCNLDFATERMSQLGISYTFTNMMDYAKNHRRYSRM